MASSSYASTEETTNACRACRLLGPCTDELRYVLRHYVPPSAFTHVIKHKISSLPRLTAQQMNLILPRGSSYTGNYDDMDISLLYTLLRNICGIPPHSNGWGYDPDPTDRSLSANIERIRIARNQCVHSSSPVLSNADFNIIWSIVRSAVVDLDSFLNNGNKFEREVDFLRHETMDPVRDCHYIEELRKQAEKDALIREIVQALKRKLDQTETDRIENHNRIQKIVDSDIPTDQLLQHMKTEETIVRHARGIIVGCAGAGKTTFLYSLLEKNLDEIDDIQSTMGLNVYEHIFTVKDGVLTVTDNHSRIPLIRVPENSIAMKDKAEDVCQKTMNDTYVLSTENDETKEEIRDRNKKKYYLSEVDGIELGAGNIVNMSMPKNEDNEGIDVSNILTPDVIKMILGAHEDEISVSMYDFAGQFVYYACHQIYMRSKAFYVLVIDMTKNFEDDVSSEEKEQKGCVFSSWKNKDYLEFWVESIKAFGGHKAPILIVVTHTEGKSKEDIFGFLKGLSALLPQNDRSWIMSNNGDFGLREENEQEKIQKLQKLKKLIVDIVSRNLDTKIKVPSSWAVLEHLLLKTGKPIISLDEINKLNEQIPKEYRVESKEAVCKFLIFFHIHGLLLFFKEDETQEKTQIQKTEPHVILSIQWFSDAFSKLITDEKHINQSIILQYIDEWERFSKTGELHCNLVDALWEDNKTPYSHKTYKEVLMAYMEKLRMLVRIGTDNMSWYVPSMNKKFFKNDKYKTGFTRSSVLCFRFTSFARFVFYRLVAYCMGLQNWNVAYDEEDRCLFQTAAVFDYKTHTVVLGICNKDIQLQVMVVNSKDLVINTNVSYEIGNLIHTALDNLTETFEDKTSVTFQRGYKCLNIICDKDDRSFTSQKQFKEIYKSGNGRKQCATCPQHKKHEVDVNETMKFWEQIDKGSPTQDDKAQGSTNDDDKTLRRGCKRKKKKTVVSINVENITTTSGMVTFGNCDKTSVKQNHGSSAKSKKI